MVSGNAIILLHNIPVITKVQNAPPTKKVNAAWRQGSRVIRVQLLWLINPRRIVAIISMKGVWWWRSIVVGKRKSTKRHTLINSIRQLLILFVFFFILIRSWYYYNCTVFILWYARSLVIMPKRDPLLFTSCKMEWKLKAPKCGKKNKKKDKREILHDL